MSTGERPNLKITALLTGRGGSSLKNKNILPVLGRPLLWYPATSAINSKLVQDYYVSSDDENILETAENLGYVRIVRPEEISRADSQHEDVVIHGLEFIKEKDRMPDIVVVILANTVVIKPEWIDDCIELMLEDESLSAVTPVYLQSDHHPFRCKKINSEGLCESFIDFGGGEVSTNRQDLDPSYFFCHNFWVLKKENFEGEIVGQEPWKFMGHRIKPYIIPGEYVDVHDRDDLLKCEEWLLRNG